MKRIHQIPVLERPREKLIRKGVASLSDFELWEVLVGSGVAGAEVGYIAKKLQKLVQKEGVNGMSYDKLTSIKGISSATASKIISSLELAKRHLVRDSTPLLTQSDIIARLGDLRTKQQEHFVCLSLDGGQRLISQRTVTIGTLDSVMAHPREVFADAIVDRAASVLIAHNHPSGDPKPTQKDISLTQQLLAAGQLLGITLKDHIILTKSESFSYRQHHLL